MKLSCVSLLIPGKSNRERINLLSSLGFDGIEIVYFEEENSIKSDIKEINSALKNNPIKVSATTYIHNNLNDFSDKDKALRRKSITKTKLGMEMAAELGCNYIWVPELRPIDPLPFFPKFNLMDKDKYNLVIEQLHELADYAKKVEVSIYIEPINRYETTFFNTLSEAVQACKDVASDYICVMGDLFHMNIEESNISQSIINSKNYLKYMHLSDNNRWLPGYGDIDFIEIFKTLFYIKFSGYMTIECGIPAPIDKELSKAVKKINDFILEAKR
ncbi:TIM barrel protein [Actinomycetota bacterium]